MKLADAIDGCGHVLRLVLCIVVAGLLGLIVWQGCSGRSIAAPVPPPPRKMEARDLPGRWQYRWGDWKNGQIVFRADGFYYARHHIQSDCEAQYCGEWKFDGRTLTLYERNVGSCFVGWTTYIIQLDRSTAAFATGKYNEATDVTLSNRRPE